MNAAERDLEKRVEELEKLSRLQTDILVAMTQGQGKMVEALEAIVPGFLVEERSDS